MGTFFLITTVGPAMLRIGRSWCPQTKSARLGVESRCGTGLQFATKASIDLSDQVHLVPDIVAHAAREWQ
jgi:hypothetical protein